MNKKLLILLFFSQFVYAEVCTNDIENLDICYSISIQQAFYMYPVSNTYIDSFEIDPGSVESEFTECGLREKFINNFRAPFVEDSHASIGVDYIRHFDIKENGVIMILGALSHIIINEDNIQKNGEVDMMSLGSIGVAGNNTYYELQKHKTLDYITSDQRSLLNEIVNSEINKPDN